MLPTTYTHNIKYMVRIYKGVRYVIPVLDYEATTHVLRLYDEGAVDVEPVDRDRLITLTRGTRHDRDFDAAKALRLITTFYPPDRLALITPPVNGVTWELKGAWQVETFDQDAETAIACTMGGYIRDSLSYEKGRRVTIPIEWVNSKTWGANPRITISNCTMAGVSGCGYDKESTILAKTLRGLFPAYDARHGAVHSCSGTGVAYLEATLKRFGYNLQWRAATKSTTVFEISEVK